MKKILFIDRDGTIILEPKSDYQVDSIDKFRFYPEAIKYLSKIVSELNYQLVMVTNQDGLGTESFQENTFWPVHNLMIDTLSGEGIKWMDVHIDRSYEKDNSPNRKPRIGMLKKYMTDDYDLENSYVIGDRWSDCQLAKNIGAQGIFIHENYSKKSHIDNLPEEVVVLKTCKWKDIYTHLAHLERKQSLNRNTRETRINLKINLDGRGISDINTGLDFLDHMLDQLSKHGGMDIFLATDGDLEVDAHHTIEDTAIALGIAFKDALGKKVGMQRYGFCLPMDDCISTVAIDFGGRPWLVWDVDFKREKIGAVPTEMFYHFFKSFTDNALCNLNIKCDGDNEHHKIESIFKAFARAIKLAKYRDLSDLSIPSTKGTL
ncbi:MAG: bifunctional histidinol-phosphatase/imidazoleglycerol-phosphate dehydratase HisB [Saprospiraceae bacterium]